MSSPDETFTLLPLTIDPSTKAISTTTSSSSDLTTSLTALNTLHRTLLSLPPETHSTPPPPLPTAPKRSAAIQKMRDQANTSLRRPGTSPLEAAKLYTYALDMALTRPGWEPAGLVREEVGLLYSNRAQAYIEAKEWALGAADAECSVECKREGNGKGWWRWGRCLVEMREWESAGRVVEEGLRVLGEGAGGEGGQGKGEGRGELEGLRREVEGRLER